MQVKTNPKTNLQNQTSSNKTSQVMEIFLAPSSGSQSQEEKMKVKTNPTNPQPLNSNPQSQEFQFEEIEEMIKGIEQKLLKNVKHRELELTMFNNLMYTKRLVFKVLFIREKIYSLVSDPQTNRVTIISIRPPKWGGTSLRVLTAQCVNNWCRVIEKETKKGKIPSYQVVGNNEVEEVDDIFD